MQASFGTEPIYISPQINAIGSRNQRSIYAPDFLIAIRFGNDYLSIDYITCTWVTDTIYYNYIRLSDPHPQNIFFYHKNLIFPWNFIKEMKWKEIVQFLILINVHVFLYILIIRCLWSCQKLLLQHSSSFVVSRGHSDKGTFPMESGLWLRQRTPDDRKLGKTGKFHF